MLDVMDDAGQTKGAGWSLTVLVDEGRLVTMKTHPLLAGMGKI